MSSSREKNGLSILGVGAAACAACCAGSILAFLGGLSLAGIASAAFIGGTGIVVAVIAGAAYVVVRHRKARGSCVVDAGEPVAVGAPTSRSPAPEPTRTLGRASLPRAGP